MNRNGLFFSYINSNLNLQVIMKLFISLYLLNLDSVLVVGADVDEGKQNLVDPTKVISNISVDIKVSVIDIQIFL